MPIESAATLKPKMEAQSEESISRIDLMTLEAAYFVHDTLCMTEPERQSGPKYSLNDEAKADDQQ